MEDNRSVSPDVFLDTSLSAKAKAVYMVLCIMGDDISSIQDLGEYMSEGVTALSAAIKELEKHEIIKRELVRFNGAQFSGAKYHILKR